MFCDRQLRCGRDHLGRADLNITYFAVGSGFHLWRWLDHSKFWSLNISHDSSANLRSWSDDRRSEAGNLALRCSGYFGSRSNSLQSRCRQVQYAPRRSRHRYRHNDRLPRNHVGERDVMLESHRRRRHDRLCAIVGIGRNRDDGLPAKFRLTLVCDCGP